MFNIKNGFFKGLLGVQKECVFFFWLCLFFSSAHICLLLTSMFYCFELLPRLKSISSTSGRDR